MVVRLGADMVHDVLRLVVALIVLAGVWRGVLELGGQQVVDVANILLGL